MELVFQGNQEYVITLKEITDLIGVEHNKAMRKVEELAKEEGFGLLAKMAIKQKTGFGERDIDTYQFTKKQAIEALERAIATKAEICKERFLLSIITGITIHKKWIGYPQKMERLKRRKQ